MANETAPTVERNQFGTFGGVFTPCLLTILGVILFMRSNFVVGQAGILGAVAILLIAKAITFLTALSTSAICTNMQVRGGGAYYLISRVLGPEFGGSIGIVLFLAQALSIPFYVLGFTEALTQTVPSLEPHFLRVALTTAGILFLITYVGAGWAIKVQYGIMAILLGSIVVFLGGALTHFSAETFTHNLSKGFTPLDTRGLIEGKYTFWMVFAIYFPAVTGIMAGINMSGDLRDPVRSIPQGMLAAIFAGLTVYLATILICGGAYSRDVLIARPYLILKENALFNLSFIVPAGMFAATLSSALGSFMGAPRVLQAVSRDRILRVLRPLGKGSQAGDEPRRAIVVAGALTFAVLLWSQWAAGGDALNLVAGIITEFFLYTYGMLNVAAFIEAAGGNPSFRPRFRFFHWGTALAGALGCLAVAFIISPWQATVATVLLTGLVVYLKRLELQSTFGDARWGFVYKAVRNSLVRLSEMKETPRNWRPTVLVFSGNPESHEALVSYGVWFEAGRGIVFLVNILEGSFEERGRFTAAAESQLQQYCKKRNIEAFPIVVVDDTFEHGIGSVIQSLKIGPIRPNLAVFGWSDDPENVPEMLAQFRIAQAMGMGIVIVRTENDEELPGSVFRKLSRKRIDIWWRGRKNGDLMVLLAHLMTRNWEWSDTGIRLLRVMAERAAYEGTLDDLQQLIASARVEATPRVIIDERSFEPVLREHSPRADCVILGFELPAPEEEMAWHERYTRMLADMPTCVLVCGAGDEGLTA